MELTCDQCGWATVSAQAIDEHKRDGCPASLEIARLKTINGKLEETVHGFMEMSRVFIEQSRAMTASMMGWPVITSIYGQVSRVDYPMLLLTDTLEFNHVFVFHAYSGFFEDKASYVAARSRAARLIVIRCMMIRFEHTGHCPVDPHRLSALTRIVNSGVLGQHATCTSNGWFNVRPVDIDAFWAALWPAFTMQSM